MGRTKRRVDDSPAAANQAHVGVVQAEIEDDLLEAAARDEGRDGIDVDDPALQREASGNPDDVGLADAFHEEPIGEVALELVQRAGAEIGADEHNPIVVSGKFVDGVETPLPHQCASSADSSRAASCAVTLF